MAVSHAPGLHVVLLLDWTCGQGNTGMKAAVPAPAPRTSGSFSSQSMRTAVEPSSSVTSRWETWVVVGVSLLLLVSMLPPFSSSTVPDMVVAKNPNPAGRECLSGRQLLGDSLHKSTTTCLLSWRDERCQRGRCTTSVVLPCVTDERVEREQGAKEEAEQCGRLNEVSPAHLARTDMPWQAMARWTRSTVVQTGDGCSDRFSLP